VNNFKTVNKLVTENMKLAYFMAAKWKLAYGPDALSIAQEGLLRAAQEYDGDGRHGEIPFGTWAGKMINWTFSKYHSYRKRSKRGGGTLDLSLNAEVRADDARTLMDTIADDRTFSSDDMLETEDTYSKLYALLNELEPRTKEIMVRRFGMHGGEAQTLEQVGAYFKITRERVRQIEAKTLKWLARQQGSEYKKPMGIRAKQRLEDLKVDISCLQEFIKVVPPPSPEPIVEVKVVKVKAPPMPKPLPKRTMDPAIKLTIRKMLDEGKRPSEISHHIQRGLPTVKKVRIEYEKELGRGIVCICGRPIYHKGRCKQVHHRQAVEEMQREGTTARKLVVQPQPQKHVQPKQEIVLVTEPPLAAKVDFSPKKLELVKPIVTAPMFINELTIPMQEGMTARIPFPMDPDYYDLLIKTLELWKSRLIRKTSKSDNNQSGSDLSNVA
jgi:RNA polymerase sigma factor (sigma-70 family)